MSNQIDTTNGTSFSEIKAAYVASNQGEGNLALSDDSVTSAISLSYFYNTTFTDGNDAPGSGTISINSVFRTTNKNGITGKLFTEQGGDDY